MLISWPGATLGSPGLRQAKQQLARLSQSENEGPDSVEQAGDHGPSDELIGTIRDHCKVQHPLLEVISGADIIERMTSAPASISRRAANARLQGMLVGEDGQTTCIVITLDASGHQHRRQLLPLVRKLVSLAANVHASEIAVVGGPREGAEVDAESIRSVNVFAPPSACVAALICWICLRSIPLTAVITSIAIICEGLVLALVHYSGTPLNAVLIVLPPLVFVLTISAGIHLSNYFLDVRREFPELAIALAAQKAMRAGTAPCLLAAGTTIIGLGSLTLVRIGPIQLFGLVAVIGVLTSLLLMLWMLPGAMTLTGRLSTTSPIVESEMVPKKALGRGWFYGLVRSRLLRPWPTIAAFVGLGIVLAAGLGQLETSVQLLRMFHPDSSIRRDYRWFESNIGGTATADLLVRFPKLREEESSLDRLTVVRSIQLAAMKSESVSGALSAVTFIPTPPRGRSLRSVSKRTTIDRLIRGPDGMLADLGLVSHDATFEVWRMTLRLWEPVGADYTEVLTELQARIEEDLKRSLASINERRDAALDASVIVTGPAAVVHSAQEVLLSDLFRSFLTAFAVVAMVMIIMLRSITGGVIAMIPNLFPTVALFGWMGLQGRPLDIGSVMSASVALGIAVDDTVHLLSRFGSRRARGLGQIRAAHGALMQCGWAMLQTTLVCGLSLMVYGFSDFVPTSQFAVLMFGLLAAALVCDTLLLPSLMASPLGRHLAHTVGSDPEAQIEHPPHHPIDARRVPVRSVRADQHG